MKNAESYEHCRAVVAEVKQFGTKANVHAALGEPVEQLAIGDFFVTNEDLTVTYCELVELFHYRDCVIRIGYIQEAIVKVRGMPLEHWVPPA